MSYTSFSLIGCDDAALAQMFSTGMDAGEVRFSEGSETNASVSQETVMYSCKMPPSFCVRPKERKYPACSCQVSQDIINYTEKRAIIERKEPKS